jgi:hypothetical protein
MHCHNWGFIRIHDLLDRKVISWVVRLNMPEYMNDHFATVPFSFFIQFKWKFKSNESIEHDVMNE